MREVVVHFGDNEALEAILTVPYKATDNLDRPTFVFLNSGLLHRVGPNRLHVTMARELAVTGIRSLRLDLSGVGDSPASGGTHSIAERWAGETVQAMDHLETRYGDSRFVLLGNCSGAAISLIAAARDSRVVGAALVNLQGPRTYLRYYLRLAVRKPAIWLRLLGGGARYRDLLNSLRGLLAGRGDKSVDEETRAFDLDGTLNSLVRHRTQVLMVYCAWDPSLDFYRLKLRPKLEQTIPATHLRTEIIPGMNHDFSLLGGQQTLRRIVRDWAASWSAHG
ncbi:alpha/beta hydrolase [Methylonatrum kenyense]|uniref:alpha/beta fold hydrolase n=1 Tax=Methylonatrum kenyense TaxID=455253 RepID=UPI0020BFC118|nr:alpha/beta hydrolase [Methylonatrum kenyense]